MAFKNNRLPAPVDVTPSDRSALMRRVRSRGTEPEKLFQAALRVAEAGFSGLPRRTSNDRRLFGRPDVAWRRAKVAVFVDGDFWHFRHGKVPATNAAYWEAKLRANVARDRLVAETLCAAGWEVLRIWASDLDKDPEFYAKWALERVALRTPLDRRTTA